MLIKRGLFIYSSYIESETATISLHTIIRLQFNCTIDTIYDRYDVILKRRTQFHRKRVQILTSFSESLHILKKTTRYTSIFIQNTTS